VNGHWNPARALLVSGIRGYQALVSPALPRSCKYHPSCSQYAIDALVEYGVMRGLVLTSWRLLRCNPLSYGGYDPVGRQTLFASRGTTADASCAAGAGLDLAPGPGAPHHVGRGAKLRAGRTARC
jgi:putative membrane protein insertion efficiency factor